MKDKSFPLLLPRCDLPKASDMNNLSEFSSYFNIPAMLNPACGSSTHSGKSADKVNAWHCYPLKSMVTHLLLYFLSSHSLLLLVCSWTSILPFLTGTWEVPTTFLSLPLLSLASLVSFPYFNTRHSHLLTADLGQILIKSTERFSLEF